MCEEHKYHIDSECVSENAIKCGPEPSALARRRAGPILARIGDFDSARQTSFAVALDKRVIEQAVEHLVPVRASEAARLRVASIDSGRMVIQVHHGKSLPPRWRGVPKTGR